MEPRSAPVAALQGLLQELRIGSLDNSDLEQGLEELSSEELGSHNSVGFGSSLSEGEDDFADTSADSGMFAEVHAALASTEPGLAANTGTALLEETLRLKMPDVGHSVGLPSSVTIQQQMQQLQLQQLQLTVEAMQQQCQQAQQVQQPASEDKHLGAAPVRTQAETAPSSLAVTALAATAPASSGFRLQMCDLNISEGTYQVLRNQRDETLTVREWVQMRFYESQSILRAESERLRREVEALRETHLSAHGRAERAERQLALRGGTVADLTQELQQLHERSKLQLEQVTAELQACEQRLLEIKDKERRFDEVSRENSRLREELQTIREALTVQSLEQKRLGKDHLEASERLLQLEAELRLARQDADGHERRARLLEDSLARRDEEALELRSKVETLREKKRELARKAALEQVGTVSEVRDQVTAEIQRFQQQAQSDLEAVRKNLSALHEKEVQMYQERLEAQSARTSELQRRLEDEEQSHQALQISAGRVRADLQNEITELTGMLKLRAFEVERAALTYEEVSVARQRLEVENEQLNRQVEVLRKEYYNLELQHREARASERAELASLREQLRGYVDLEKELDTAIRACAESPAAIGLEGLSASAADGRTVAEALLIGTTLASAPASAQRRIQQSLLLAQELQRRTREACEARAALSVSKAEAKCLAEELEIARRESKAASGSSPQAYLLDALRKAEAEALRLRRDVSSQFQELERCRQQASTAQAARIRAEDDMRQLLSQRQHLEGLKTIMLGSSIQECQAVARSHSTGETQGPVPRHRGRAPSQQPQAAAGPAWFQKLRGQLSDGSKDTIRIHNTGAKVLLRP